MKILISLPMRDRPVDEIREDMNYIFNLVRSEYESIGEQVELIDTIWPIEPGIDISDESTWYLGKTIQALDEADVVVFHPNWRTARGCIIEHMICALYNIPYCDISMDYGDHEDDGIEDNTHDWDVAGAVNAELSRRVAEEEGLSEDDILHEEDIEDALGFEHDDVDDLIESDPDLNPYAQHNEIDIAIMDEFDENGKLINSDILEPGEYNADVR